MRPLRPAAGALLVAAAAALPYARTFDVPFQLDDLRAIVAAPAVHAPELSPGALAPAAAGFPGGRWLSALSFAATYAVAGLRPAPWHAVNLGLHVLAALVVLALAREVLARADPGLAPDRRGRAALVAALVFAVHPLQTMAVTYVVQRMAVLSALLSLAALLAWARGRRPGATRPVAWGIAAAVSGFLAFSAKENAAVLPLLVLAFEGLVVGGLPARLRRHAAAVAIAAAALAAAAAAAYAGIAGTAYADPFVSRLSVSERLLTQPRVLALYLAGFVLPWPGWLHADRLVEPSRGLLDPPATLAALLLLGLVVAAALRLRRRAPAVAFGVAFFFVALAIEQSVLPLDLAFEHRVYLPSFGLALAAGWALERAAGALRRGPWPAAVPLVVLLAAGTWARNEQWRDPVALHGQDVAAFPAAPRPLLNLGAAYRASGDIDRAEATFERLVALDPGNALGWSNLAHVALDRGDPLGALALADRALRASPRCAPCRYNRAVALLQAGLDDAALEAFREAVEVTPGDALARANLGALLLRRGRLAEATDELARAVSADPGCALAWANLSAAQRLSGDRGAAVASARRALAADPASGAGRDALERALRP